MVIRCRGARCDERVSLVPFVRSAARRTIDRRPEQTVGANDASHRVACRRLANAFRGIVLTSIVLARQTHDGMVSTSLKSCFVALALIDWACTHRLFCMPADHSGGVCVHTPTRMGGRRGGYREGCVRTDACTDACTQKSMRAGRCVQVLKKSMRVCVHRCVRPKVDACRSMRVKSAGPSRTNIRAADLSAGFHRFG